MGHLFRIIKKSRKQNNGAMFLKTAPVVVALLLALSLVSDRACAVLRHGAWKSPGQQSSSVNALNAYTDRHDATPINSPACRSDCTRAFALPDASASWCEKKPAFRPTASSPHVAVAAREASYTALSNVTPHPLSNVLLTQLPPFILNCVLLC